MIFHPFHPFHMCVPFPLFTAGVENPRAREKKKKRKKRKNNWGEGLELAEFSEPVFQGGVFLLEGLDLASELFDGFSLVGAIA